jgi:hypothetical protein
MDKKITEALARPFKLNELEWRIGQSGLTKKGDVWATCFTYIQSRAVYTRLNQVFGVHGWKNDFEEVNDINGNLQYYKYTISIFDKEAGHWVTKSDVAEPTDFEPFKGGVSDSAKRAAVLLGIGAYLYDLEANFVNVHKTRQQGARKAKCKDQWYFWTPPALPEWALPKEGK